jgi:hypothetical protein
MLSNLLENKLIDGSRHFVDMPEVAFFDDFYDHTEELEGARLTEFVTDGVTGMWLDFEFRGHEFSVTNQFGDYWFFVRDPECSEEILFEIIEHFRQLLD